MKVYLSPLAEFKLEVLIQYIEVEWGIKSRNRFIEKLKSSLDILSSFPKSNPKTDKLDGVYKAIITPQTSLFYRIVEDEVEVITIFDNRQDPQRVIEAIRKQFR